MAPLPSNVRLSRRPILGAGLAAMLALPARAGPQGSTPALRLRFSHVVADDTPKGLMAQRLQALVAQRSDGRIAVDVFPSARLYGDRDEMEALRTGAVDMLAPSLSKFGRVGFPEFEVFDLPFLFDSLDQVRKLTQGPIGLRLLRNLQRQGLVGLGFFDNGFKHMSANRTLVTPSDFKGLRMRIQGSRVIAAQMRALGAWPVPLPFSTTREALAKGIVQGTENPLSNFWTQGMHEVQGHLSLTRHGYLGYAVVSSERFWSRLTPVDRELIESALRESVEYGNRIAGAQQDKAFAALRNWGGTTIHDPSPDQRQTLARAVEPVYTELGRRIGPRWIEDVRQAIRK